MEGYMIKIESFDLLKTRELVMVDMVEVKEELL